MRKIAIVGTAPLSKDMTPVDDNDWEIWVCSAGNMNSPTVTKRITRWFELHAMVELEGQENKSWVQPYIPWLKAQTFPVWMLEQNDMIPQAHVFPCRELIAEFGREWFTSSIAWMMALAIAEKVDMIGIFGVDMAADVEHYTAQRAGCRYFINEAEKRGIKVQIPWESCLGTPPPIYGLWENTPMGRRINVSEQLLTQKRAEIAATEDRMKLEKCFFDGALEQLRYFKRTFADGANAFAFMQLPEIEAAAKVAVDKALGVNVPVVSAATAATDGSMTSIPLSGESKLTPPPEIEDEMPRIAAGKANGSGGHVPGHTTPPERRTRGRASQGQAKA
jgi:hypothetical protein